MNKRISDYYYIFDGRSGRSVAVERSSGKPASVVPNKELNDEMKLARYLESEQSSYVLRAFACWCVRQTWQEEAPSQRCYNLWDTARAVSARRAPVSALREVRAASDDEAVAASTIGLPRRSPEAAQLLAARGCADPDVYTAVHDAMHMSLRWAECVAQSDPETAIRMMRTRHRNALLDAINGEAPFATENTATEAPREPDA